MTTFREKYRRENIEPALYPGRLTTEDFNKLMENEEKWFAKQEEKEKQAKKA